MVSEISSDIPVCYFHGTVLGQIDLHLEDPVKKLGFMTGFSGQAIFCGHVEVFLKDRLVVGMGALVDN